MKWLALIVGLLGLGINVWFMTQGRYLDAAMGLFYSVACLFGAYQLHRLNQEKP